MELNGERTIAASVDATWAALNDPEILKACVAGCESLERVADDAFVAVVAMKIGPVSARFKGNLKLTNVQPPTSYTINFDGQGGVAGFGRGAADVSLAAIDPTTTRLSYAARATVGGKMAQIGSRLIDATAAKITDDFFKAFEGQLQSRAAPERFAPPPAQTAPIVVTASDTRSPLADLVRRPPGPREPAGPLGWALAAIVVVVTIALIAL